MRKKVLICTEDWAGSGHVMAALALQQAFSEKAQEWDAVIVNGLSTASPFLKRVSQSVYFASLQYAPFLWQRLYNRNHQLSKMIQKPLAFFLAKQLLIKIIHQEKPDIVIATHAYCLSALAELKTRYKQPFLLFSVFTDFTINSFWINPAIDAYVVAHGSLKDRLIEDYQIEPERVFVNGIPLRTAFWHNRQPSKLQWKKRLQLREDLFTVLLCGGGGGFVDFAKLLVAFQQIDQPLQIIMIVGKNQQKLESCQQLLKTMSVHHHVYLFGYVEKIWEWMGAADVIISKPGGLTCSEALAMGTPLVLYQPLPGQEQRNSQFLQEQGVAKVVNELKDVLYLLNNWQNSSEEWQETARRSKQFGKPDAAFRTVDVILAMGRRGERDWNFF